MAGRAVVTITLALVVATVYVLPRPWKHAWAPFHFNVATVIRREGMCHAPLAAPLTKMPALSEAPSSAPPSPQGTSTISASQAPHTRPNMETVLPSESPANTASGIAGSPLPKRSPASACVGMGCRLHAGLIPVFGTYFFLEGVCVNATTFVIQPFSAADERQLHHEWQACCSTPNMSATVNKPECHTPNGDHFCLPLTVWGIDVVIGRAYDYNASIMLSGRSFLLDTYVRGWYHFGHSVSKFVQLWSLDATFEHVVLNRMALPPGKAESHYVGSSDAHLAHVYNLTVGDKAHSMGAQLHFVGNRKPLCMANVTHVTSAEAVFFNFYAAQRWRENVLHDKLHIPLRPCPPGRAVLLQRYEGTSLRRVTNEDVIEQVAAEFGVPKIERLRLGSLNSTEQQIAAFSSFGLVFTTHTSQLKNLVFAAPNAAVVELSAHFLDDRVSAFSEGMEYLNVTYETSRSHRVNVTEACNLPAFKDVHCSLTANATILRKSLAAVLRKQRAACPDLRYT